VLDGRITRTHLPYRLDGQTPINPALLLKRLWVEGTADEITNDVQTAQLAAVAQACAQTPPELLTAIHHRRRAAVTGIAARHGTGARTLRALVIRPMWRVVVGHGEESAQETSMTLSPTYGLPVVPGSALKGVAAAQAANVLSSSDLVRLFGGPRPGTDRDTEAGGRGSVVVLDALPVRPPTVVVDVLTPHVKPYYDEAASTGTPRTPPAEYHNPVPVRFLAVEATPFRTLVAGPERDVALFTDLLTTALDELGVGAKTAAGYGYCTLTVEEPT
jgi:CRISPR-associated protein Cmr6